MLIRDCNFLSFFCILFFHCIVLPSATEKYRSYTDPDEILHFQRGLEDPTTGDLYILDDRNAIHQFKADLTPITSGATEISPYMVSANRSSPEEQLFLDLDLGAKYLLCSPGSCGIAVKGLPGKGVWVWQKLDQTIPANVFCRTGTSVLGMVHSFQDSTFLITSSETSSPDMPVLSSRKLVNTGQQFNFQFTQQSSPRSLHPPVEGKIFPHESIRADYRIKPIFLGKRSQPDPDIPSGYTYGYFLSVHVQKNGQRQSVETRLGRFCIGDVTLASYVEVKIECHARVATEFDYTVAVAATLRDDGKNGVLAITFGRPNGASWNVRENENNAVALCVYSLKDIDDYFNNEIKECYLNGRRTILPWIKGAGKLCKSSEKLVRIATENQTFKEQLCMNSWKPTANGFIAGSELSALSTVAVETFSERTQGLQLVQSPLPSTIEQPGILIIAKGKLYLKDEVGHIIGSRTVVSGKLSKSSTRVPFQAFLHGNQTKYGLLRGDKIESIPIGCGMYTDCGDCLTYPAKELRCGWCRNPIHPDFSCASLTECEEQHYSGRPGIWLGNQTCPPEIIDFTPKNGSTEGNTELRITGNYFGRPEDTRVLVKIGRDSNWSPCETIQRNYTLITCLTQVKSDTLDVSGHYIDVTVTDFQKALTEPFRCNGNNYTVEDQFHYLKAEVTNFSPAFGPIWGGTLVRLEGYNLNIGNRRSIKIGQNSTCNMESEDDTHISCRMPASENGLDSKVMLQLYIDDRLVVKNASIFGYRPDPVLRDWPSAAVSVMSGGTKLIFTGHNFNSLPFAPRLLVFDSTKAYNISTCSTESDTQIVCLTPSIESFSDPSAESITLEAGITFSDCELPSGIGPHCPEKNGTLLYLLDPQFKTITVEETEDPLKCEASLEGGYYSRLDLQSIHVDIGSNECYEPKLDEKGTLRCSIECPKDTKGQQFSAWIKYGNAKTALNDVTFPVDATYTRSLAVESRPGTIPTRWFAIGLTFACGILFCLGGLVWYSRTRGKSWARKFFGLSFPSADLSSDSNQSSPEEIVLIPPGTPSSPTGSNLSCRPLPLSPVRVVSQQNLVSNQLYGTQSCIPAEEKPNQRLPDSIKTLVDELHLSKCIIALSNLVIGTEIGRGSRGIVHRGTLSVNHSSGATLKLSVAVKSLEAFYLNCDSDIRAFLEECAFMLKLQHRNVMRLEGVCFTDLNEPKLILPLMSNGDLLRYVQSRPPLPEYSVLNFAIQIAKGMRYLSSEAPDQSIIHRDLAARNCMLDENLQVIIADFGLSRDVHRSHDLTYNARNGKQIVAVRWLSPESFAGEYSSKSDVWAFGIVIWELFEQGQRPYQAAIGEPRDDKLVVALRQYIDEGGRLTKPPQCSLELYDLMQRCWRRDPLDRPDFNDIVTELVELKKLQVLDGDGYMQV